MKGAPEERIQSNQRLGRHENDLMDAHKKSNGAVFDGRAEVANAGGKSTVTASALNERKPRYRVSERCLAMRATVGE